MPSEWRKKLDHRKRRRKRREKLTQQFADAIRLERVSGRKLTPERLDELVLKYLGRPRKRR
jgi:predicted N-acyltransferase